MPHGYGALDGAPTSRALPISGSNSCRFVPLCLTDPGYAATAVVVLPKAQFVLNNVRIVAAIELPYRDTSPLFMFMSISTTWLIGVPGQIVWLQEQDRRAGAN